MILKIFIGTLIIIGSLGLLIWAQRLKENNVRKSNSCTTPSNHSCDCCQESSGCDSHTKNSNLPKPSC